MRNTSTAWVSGTGNVQYVIDKYAEIGRHYLDDLPAAQQRINALAASHPWKPLLGGLDVQLVQTLFNAQTWQAVDEFWKSQDMDHAVRACSHLVPMLLEFNKQFVRACVAEKSDQWEFVRQHFSNPAHGTPDALYGDLKDTYDAVETLLSTLQKITSLMQDCRDFIPADDIDALEAELSYWAQVVGQWFNYVWTNVAQESPAQAATAGAAGGAGAAARGTSRAGARTAASSPRGAGAGAPVPSGVIQTSPSAAARRAPLLVPKISKAPDLPDKFKKGFLRRGNKVLPDDHAAKIADAVKYDAMMMTLLVKRIRKDLVGIEGPLFALRNHATKDNDTPWAYRAYGEDIDQLQFQLRGLLLAAEGNIRDFRRYDKIIRDGADSLTLEDAAHAATTVTLKLAEIGKLIDTVIAPAASMQAVVDQHRRTAAAPRDAREWQALKECFGALATHSAQTGRKCRKILDRLNSILKDEDFKYKHLSYQGIGRITGQSAGQETVKVTCVTTINRNLVAADKYVDGLRV